MCLCLLEVCTGYDVGTELCSAGDSENFSLVWKISFSLSLLCVCVHLQRCLQNLEFLLAGVRGSCEPPDKDTRNWAWILCKSSVYLLTARLFLPGCSLRGLCWLTHKYHGSPCLCSPSTQVTSNSSRVCLCVCVVYPMSHLPSIWKDFSVRLKNEERSNINHILKHTHCELQSGGESDGIIKLQQ